MWTLNYYFFFKSCGCVAALCEAVFPAAEFDNANGATEILNTGCTHDGETDVVISEVIVQNKDWTKCIWTHELFFPLFSLLCVFPWSAEAVSFSSWCILLLLFCCFLKHVGLIKCIMLRVTVWESLGKFAETLGLSVIRCYTYAYKNVHLEFHTCSRTAMVSIFGQERSNARNDIRDFSCGFPIHATVLLRTKGRILLKCIQGYLWFSK